MKAYIRPSSHGRPQGGPGTQAESGLFGESAWVPRFSLRLTVG